MSLINEKRLIGQCYAARGTVNIELKIQFIATVEAQLLPGKIGQPACLHGYGILATEQLIDPRGK
ncbi:hypothetical protein ABB30_09360 [Stenotrophomonas ginsengisoli]|uniref:Uncharacterized protein n=1 Tax=Stenotrophomonas ginsengisoli TaxID=336566 RepID=A0A0R0D319_9GAMM|nr:hypothetical protein ABB30_09360 [Stenotrophomonas ginsengisoli]